MKTKSLVAALLLCCASNLVSITPFCTGPLYPVGAFRYLWGVLRSSCISPTHIISQLFFNGVHHITGHLRGKDPEIVGKDDKNESQEKTPAIFPKIFIYSL